ncbi:unnamed protein product [Citrullus colocynthis]|uniref:Avr9/Cf-9 rapidly elicited protein n=1 Tax=Citrullus colocynthis TaxID=252529 RepID=A0ABP0XRP0_9ROSI
MPVRNFKSSNKEGIPYKIPFSFLNSHQTPHQQTLNPNNNSRNSTNFQKKKKKKKKKKKMNSMFSFFDAFAAELLLGKFVRDSSSVPSFTPNNGGSASSAASASPKSLPNKKHEANSKNSSMKPRFALELDGLNCFETLVPN